MNPTKENKHATIKLPYAYSLSQKRMVHITLAMQLSREEKYICDSCGMEVRPRGGDGKLVVEHFYHKEKAKQECKVSPWVSLRSMALQILDESAAIAIPGGIILNSVSSCITPLNIKNSSTGHDRHCISSFGEYTIHFLTPEHPLQSLPGEYFYDKAILSIDLEEVFNVDIKEQDAFLRDTVLLLNEYKKWHIPHKSLNVYQEEILSQEEAEKEIQRFEEEEKKRLELEERWKQNQEIRMKNLKRQLLESKEKEDKSNY